MTRLKVFSGFFVFLSVCIVVSPAIAKSNVISPPPSPEVHVTLGWAAYDEDHAAVDYIVEGRFEVPAGYHSIDCPVGEARIISASGHDISGLVFTSCRALGENKYSVTQFFYSDFQNNSPESLKITVGDITLMPVGDGEIMKLPSVGTYTFNGKFKQACDISGYPNQVEHINGVSLVVTRVDFTPSMIKVDACITLPDTKDWIPDAYIVQAGKRIHVDEWFIPNYKEDPNFFERLERCYTFLIYTDIQDFRKITTGSTLFGLKEIHTSIPEALDDQGLKKVKSELEKHGLKPELDRSGYYRFTRDIADSNLGLKVKVGLFRYIEKTLPDRVPGPIEITIR